MQNLGLIPGLSLRSNPGLELANAFGVITVGWNVFDVQPGTASERLLTDRRLRLDPERSQITCQPYALSLTWHVLPEGY